MSFHRTTHCNNSNSEIIGNTIVGNDHGVYCENSSNPIIRYIINVDDSITIDARYNWFGSLEGADARNIIGHWDGSWQKCSESGVNTTDAGNYSGYVWARLLRRVR